MKQIIVQVLYYFKENRIIEKQFVREVIKETAKSYTTDTDEIFRKEFDNKPRLLYGNTVELWKSLVIKSNEDVEQIRAKYCTELTQQLKRYLIDRINKSIIV